MKSNIRKNFIFNLVFQVITIAYPIFVTPYLARIFEPDGIGRYSFTVSIVTYFTLIFTCIGRYGFREISYCNEDKDKESKTFWEVFFIKLILLLICSVIYCSIAFCMPKYKVLLLIQWVGILNGVFDISWFLQSKQNFKVTAIIGVINKLLLLVLIFLLIKEKSDINTYAFLICFVTLLGSLSMWFSLKSKVNKPQNICIKKHLKNCFLISLPFILIEVYSSIDKTMLGLITGLDTENGYYEETIKIIRILMTVVTSMSIVKAPSHSEYIIGNNNKELIKSLINSFKYCFFISIPLMFGIVCISDIFVPIFLGDGYDKVIYLIYWYSPFVIMYGIVDLLAIQYFVPAKKQQVYTYAVLISLIINIIFNVLLVMWKMSLGAIIATVISEIVCCFILLYKFKNIIKLRVVLNSVWKFVVSGVIMFTVLIIIRTLLHINIPIVELILTVVIGAILYIGTLLLLREEYLLDIINLVNKKLKRGN